MKTLDGTITSSQENIGTKQEQLGYSIVPRDKTPVSIYYIGDNPFENKKLRPFDGHRVRAIGDFDRGIFVIREIELLE